jgi:hypothetical protein
MRDGGGGGAVVSCTFYFAMFIVWVKIGRISLNTLAPQVSPQIVFGRLLISKVNLNKTETKKQARGLIFSKFYLRKEGTRLT